MSDDELKAKWAKIDNLPDAVDQFMEHSMYVGTDPYYADMNDALWAMLERCRNIKPADGEALAQCCMCGKTGLSTAEDGGPECELHDGRWVCSSECWDIAVSVIDRLLAPRPAEPAQVDVRARLAAARETFCMASPGSDEEFTSLLLGFDTAAAIINGPKT